MDLVFKVMRTAVILVCLLTISTIPAVTAENNSESTVITVDSTNLRFSPSSVTINETESVRFFWDGQFLPHNAVEENGVFDSGDTQTDEDYTFTFIKGLNGTFTYFCEPHRSLGMVGTITVTPIEDSNETNQTDNQTVIDDMEEDESFLPFLQFPIFMSVLIVASLFNRIKADE